MTKKSVTELLDALRGAAEAAAFFEALAEQAAAAARREWWTEGAGEFGALERGFTRDVQKVANLAETMREKYHRHAVKAAEDLRNRT